MDKNLIYTILTSVVIILAIFGIAYYMGWNSVKQKLLYLMLQAKRYAKDSVLRTGQEQEDWVVRRAMDLIPIQYKAIIKLIAMFSGKSVEDFIRGIVKFLFHNLRDYVDDGSLNDSVQ